MYDLAGYAAMLADARRVQAYSSALRATIKPGALVIEVGTGVGAFAVIARQFGARRVIAIEPDDAIAVARLVAEENGASEAIDFIQDVASNVQPAGRADVVFADLRGVLPLLSRYLESMIDARKRFLAPGGTIIPNVDFLRTAVVEAPDDYREFTPTCFGDGYNVNLQALHCFTTNVWRSRRFKSSQVVTEPKTWATIDYRTLDSPHVDGEARLTVTRNATGHGFALWFDSTLVEGVTISNAPGAPSLVYGMAFLPWSHPVELEIGDNISVRLQARHVRGDYVWRWQTEVYPAGSESKPEARFDQTTFRSVPFLPSHLNKGAAEHAPRLSEDGRVERFILEAIDGQTCNAEIARRLSGEFPRRFPEFSDALACVGEVARRLSER